MRKTALIAAGAIATAGIAAPAATAGPEEFKFSVEVSGAKGGTKKKPRAHALTTEFNLIGPKPTRETQYATTQSTIFFDKAFKFNQRKFRVVCDAQRVLNNPDSCPRASRVGNGTGEAENYATPEVPSPLELRAFQGPNQLLFIRVETNQPTNVRGIIYGKLSKAGGRYGSKLVAKIPGPEDEERYGNLQNPLGDIKPTLSKFLLTTGATYRRIPYIQTTGCPRSKRWRFRADLVFTDGTTATDNASVPCRR